MAPRGPLPPWRHGNPLVHGAPPPAPPRKKPRPPSPLASDERRNPRQPSLPLARIHADRSPASSPASPPARRVCKARGRGPVGRRWPVSAAERRSPWFRPRRPARIAVAAATAAAAAGPASAAAGGDRGSRKAVAGARRRGGR
ncbi:MAG: hypothetical protein BJ554DRAFT_12, partial [Olpidium bornovanus]